MFSESITPVPETNDCERCVSDFSAGGGCECLNKQDCNLSALIPEGCSACGFEAIQFCGNTGY